MGTLGDSGEVEKGRTAKSDMRDADQLSLLVDGVEDMVKRYGDAIGRSDGYDLCSQPLEAIVDVVVRGKVQPITDQLVAVSAPVETGSHDRLADGNILMHDHAPFRGADDRADQVATGKWHLPPALLPGQLPVAQVSVNSLIAVWARRGMGPSEWLIM